MYRVHRTNNVLNRYMITLNDFPVWATTTLTGARYWISRDRRRRNEAKIPASRRFPVVHEEKS